MKNKPEKFVSKLNTKILKCNFQIKRNSDFDVKRHLFEKVTILRNIKKLIKQF